MTLLGNNIPSKVVRNFGVPKSSSIDIGLGFKVVHIVC
jgi:hypothetical protein